MVAMVRKLQKHYLCGYLFLTPWQVTTLSAALPLPRTLTMLTLTLSSPRACMLAARDTVEGIVNEDEI